MGTEWVESRDTSEHPAYGLPTAPRQRAIRPSPSTVVRLTHPAPVGLQGRFLLIVPVFPERYENASSVMFVLFKESTISKLYLGRGPSSPFTSNG